MSDTYNRIKAFFYTLGTQYQTYIIIIVIVIIILSTLCCIYRNKTSVSTTSSIAPPKAIGLLATHAPFPIVEAASSFGEWEF